MAKLTDVLIGVGTTPNDKKGDSLRNAFQKVNLGFTDLYTKLGLVDGSGLNLGAFEFAGSVMTTTDSTPIVIDQSVTVSSDLTVGGDIVPNIANGGTLGSLAKPFRSLYVSNNTVFLGGVPLSLEPGTNELRVNNVPISQRITYTDIPNAPVDISDLTDDDGLLGGGGNANTGNFTFDQDTITNGGGLILNTNRGTLAIGTNMEVPGVAGHFHIGFDGSNSEANANDLFLGDDYNYVKLPGSELNANDFGVEIGTHDRDGGDSHVWRFNTDGGLTFPQGTFLGYSDPGGFIIDGAVDKDIAIYTYSGADAHGWTFGEDGDLTLPAGGDILDSEGNSVLGGGSNSYTPDDSDNWNDPTVNTVAAALDELAAKVAALENFEIDGGNAYTPAAGELIIDGNGA
jgi:hypothetical protein